MDKIDIQLLIENRVVGRHEGCPFCGTSLIRETDLGQRKCTGCGSVI